MANSTSSTTGRSPTAISSSFSSSFLSGTTSLPSSISSTSSTFPSSATLSEFSAPTPTSTIASAPATTPVITTALSVVKSTLPPTTVTLTSTSSTPPPAATSSSSTASSSSLSSSSSVAAALATGSGSSSSGGISSGGKIAVAVVVPVLAVAVLLFALLFLWRRRKQKKDAEELRRKEVEEYGFNPNSDPTIPVISGTSTAGEQQMVEDGNGGYRGWGATPIVRQPSTTLSGGNPPIGMAFSDTSPGGPSPSPTHGPASEAHSGDPLVNSPNRPPTAESEGIGALGAAPVAGTYRQDIHRGPSNASSSYSAGNRSENSAEASLPGAPHPSNYYNNDAAYGYDDGYPPNGPYAEVSGQPIIRDVQARRNTRIENPTIPPQQGNSGIAQNF